jgi:hypothetical protein
MLVGLPNPKNPDIDAALKVLDELMASDKAQYDNWSEAGDLPYREKCADRIHAFALMIEGLDVLSRERARDAAETCSCCGGKLWDCGCWGSVGPNGVTSCWGTHGPSKALKGKQEAERCPSSTP